MLVLFNLVTCESKLAVQIHTCCTRLCPVALQVDMTHLEAPHIPQTCEMMNLAVWMYNSP